MSAPAGSLCAVLLNPPLTSGNRTRGAIYRAAELLGNNCVTVTNLVGVATSSSSALATASVPMEEWFAARPSLIRAVSESNALLFGWGLTAHLGAARQAVQEQIKWLLDEAYRAGHSEAWAVGDARHPSRWHQYTADLHGRTSGGSSDDRLLAVLEKRPLGYFYPTMAAGRR